MTLLALSLPLLAPPLLVEEAHAAGTGTDEYLSTIEMVPPNIIFVVDMSDDMDQPCSGSGSGDTCFEDVIQSIDQVARHFDGARYGVVGTADSDSDDDFYEIVPVGSSYAEMSAALNASTLQPWSSDTRNLAEVLEELAENYLQNSVSDDGVDDDGDGLTGDWDETPIGYTCSDTHIIVLTRDRPEDDDQVATNYQGASSSSATEVSCDDSGITTPDEQCFYDNAVAQIYNTDQSTLADYQRATIHTIGLNITAGSIAESLFTNAALNTASEGVYTSATTQTEILSSILAVMSDVMAGVYTRSQPVITSDGAYVIYTFYEMTGDNPLAEGHIRAYQIDDDPGSSTYGMVLYDGPAEYDGALWDGGDLLVSRPVTASESNPGDHDGVGKRDIYTFYGNHPSAPVLGGLAAEATADRRVGLDYEFSTAVGASPTALDLFLNTGTDGTADACSGGILDVIDEAYDLNEDCLVTGDDVQTLIDFARGLPEAQFEYIGMERGRWKLGDSPYSVPAVVTARNDIFTTDLTYRRFIEGLVFDEVPPIVLVAANDGMLHAFRLTDDPSTATENEEGEELWAWVPEYILWREQPTPWSNHLVDLMWYGRSFLFDGSPVVEDVWIDYDGDGSKESDGSEWRRVVVVQQGSGGPTTLALDITDPQFPQFLWEHQNETDPYGQGYTVGRPVIFNVYDAEDGSGHDQWVAMWGGGAPVPYTDSSGYEYYKAIQANLYIWNIADDYWGTESVGYRDDGDNVQSAFPDLTSNGGGQSPSTINYDGRLGRGYYEYAYIAAALAAVDVDSDGDGDVVYFPVTTSYRPTDEGGAGPSDVETPGSTWMFKAIVDTSDPDEFTWCEFYDPKDGTDGSNGVGARPEVYYAATTSWLSSPPGALGIYWGTGTPYSRDGSSQGYFFAMYDADPTECTSTAQPIACSGTDGTVRDGYFPLEAGEGLTSEPIVYAGVVYFTTYTPDVDRCEMGDSDIYGIRFDDCSPGLDTNGDGSADAGDDHSVEVENQFVSGLTITEQGTVLYGTSDHQLEVINAATDPFLGTAGIAWMEIY